ncbi:MAG: hypothetical protein QOI58_3020 [Thermoanaerobaculia bacterium]|jgi:hypothetical protein|nr:hypothetical protein [Thermoanaerobaculia bacterium]
MNCRASGGSECPSLANDPWLATTTDLNIARAFNERNQFGIVKIDSNKVPGPQVRAREVHPRVSRWLPVPSINLAAGGIDVRHIPAQRDPRLDEVMNEQVIDLERRFDDIVLQVLEPIHMRKEIDPVAMGELRKVLDELGRVFQNEKYVPKKLVGIFGSYSRPFWVRLITPNTQNRFEWQLGTFRSGCGVSLGRDGESESFGVALDAEHRDKVKPLRHTVECW